MIRSVFVSMMFSCVPQTETKCHHAQYIGKVGADRVGIYSLAPETAASSEPAVTHLYVAEFADV
jgi:hypothetical protein